MIGFTRPITTQSNSETYNPTSPNFSSTTIASSESIDVLSWVSLSSSENTPLLGRNHNYERSPCMKVNWPEDLPPSYEEAIRAPYGAMAASTSASASTSVSAPAPPLHINPPVCLPQFNLPVNQYVMQQVRFQNYQNFLTAQYDMMLHFSHFMEQFQSVSEIVDIKFRKNDSTLTDIFSFINSPRLIMH